MLGDATLEQARRGDRAAFAALVRMHQRRVFSLGLRMLGRRDLAEDLAQDVFLQLYRRLGDIESPDHLEFWLRRVASNQAIDRLRSNPPERALPLPDDSLHAPEPRASDPLLARRLQQHLAELPAERRAVVVLRYQEDLDPPDIARTLDMPVNTVKSHLQRALNQLRAQTEDLRHD